MSAPALFPYGKLRRVSAQAATILAENPGVMTLEGTNTWLLRSDPEREAVVIDPGPADDAHLAAIVAAAGRVSQILLTHGHDDHSAGAKALHELTGAPVRALDPKFRLGSEGLAEGEVIDSAGIVLRVWTTPGHTADSLSFLLAGGSGDDSDAVLTGDTVLGRGTTVIATPDGDLGAYLASVRRLQSLGPIQVLPGHGPEIADAAAVAGAYLAHRAERLEQVRRALIHFGLEPVEASAKAVVEAVYADVDRTLWEAAEMSVKAQLAYLARQI